MHTKLTTAKPEVLNWEEIETMSSQWKVLEGLSMPLMVQTEFDLHRYTIYLTDLTNVWMESLDRRHIIKRSFDLDTSIDPSEDASQMRAFLSHIEQVFSEDSTAELCMSSNDDADHVTMNMKIPLPHPLPSLKWACELSRCSQDVLTERLVLPLLASRLKSTIEKTSLLSHIKERDSIITKLITQMQHDGSDISMIFPGSVASKLGNKADVREALGKSIRGMGEFNEHQWHNHMQQLPPSSHNMDAKIPEKALNLLILSYTTSSSSKSPWWNSARRSRGENSGAITNLETGAVCKAAEAPNGKMKASDEADIQVNGNSMSLFAASSKYYDQQRSPTPPRRLSESRHELIAHSRQELMPERNRYDGSTTDDSDNEAPEPQMKKHLSKEPAKDVRSDRNEHLEQRESVQSFNKMDGGGTSEDVHDLKHDSTTLSPSEGASAPTEAHFAKKPRIGKIGGKKKAADDMSAKESQMATRPKEDAFTDEAKTSEHMPPPNMAPQPQSPARGRNITQNAEPTSCREDSAERANKNRENLKRKLNHEQASKKKTRKF